MTLLPLVMSTVLAAGFGDDLEHQPLGPVAQVDPTMDASLFVAWSVPNGVEPGATFNVSIIMRNRGANRWSEEDLVRLGAESPQDNMNWGQTRIQFPPDVRVHSGEDYDFRAELTAPTTPGTYDFQWQLVRENVHWFGELTPVAKIEVAVGAGESGDSGGSSGGASGTSGAGSTTGVSSNGDGAGDDGDGTGVDGTGGANDPTQAGTLGGAEVTGGTARMDEGGCRQHAARSGSWSWAWLLVALGLPLRRRRRASDT